MTTNTLYRIRDFAAGLKLRLFFLSSVLFLLHPATISAGDRNLLLNLAGSWKFSIGDNMEWQKLDFKDSAWETIKVPSAWEDQGFYGYNGFAWYRTSFNVTKEMKNRDIYLSLGYIGDVDQVYLNGKLIGFSGSFPPEFSSAIQAKRKYPIPENFLLDGKNVIAVRVYNYQLEGGIVSGDIGICSFSTVRPDISLLGVWNFKTGDNTIYKEVTYQDKHWRKIVVPGNWENQGYKDFNKTCWYRKHVYVPKTFANQHFVLMLGKLTDSCQVYFNGVLLSANTEERIKEKGLHSGGSKVILVLHIPDSLLQMNKINLIAVRIGSTADIGGIEDFPVGLMRIENYNRYGRLLEEAEAN